jgi:hypothetical protein
MNRGIGDEARKTIDIKESPGFAHPRIVTSFSRRRKSILVEETRRFLPPDAVTLPTRFPEEPLK